MSQMPKPVLTVEDLAVSFANGDGPRIRAVNGVQMTLFPRQTLAVVGESGCGKSVTALSTLRLIPTPPGRYDRGRIIFSPPGAEPCDLLKIDNKALHHIRGGQIAMIFQEPMTSLNPVYTVGEQITEAILLHQTNSRREAREIAVRAMEEVGIPNPAARLKAYPHEFSGGMRQRVMIAMALACEPAILLADEPTTALDVTIQAQILDLITALKTTRNLAVMLITHDLAVVSEQADVVCVMYAGHVVEYASIETITANPRHPYTRGLLACVPRLGHRNDRLQTVREYVDSPQALEPILCKKEPFIPWWPWHEPPEPGLAYTLIEHAKNHWTAVWCDPHRTPDRTPLIPPEPARAPQPSTSTTIN
jgi:ABC-type dipeptide/oligopeptide/nickel transport system ATPase component